MHRPLARCLTLLIVTVASRPAHAQEGRLTMSALFGPSVLSLTQVEEDGRRDIAVYNQNGIPIENYDPLPFGLSAEGQIEYRFDRDLSMNLFGLYTWTGTSTAYADSARTLSLDRRITSTDIGLDINYYFPPLVYDAEAALFVGLGRMVGKAEQTTGQSHRKKSADTTVSVTDQDSYATYKKTKLYVRVGGRVLIPLTGSLWIHAQALYKFAPIGKLDGTLRQFTLVRPHTTTIEFDFTTIDVKLGISYVIE